MKKNRLLVLSLLACTLLASCGEKNTQIKDGDQAVGKVDESQTILNLQSFYENLKTSTGGSKAVEKLLETIASIEYSDENLANFEETHSVKDYHTTQSLKDDITEGFETIIDGTSYLDEDGNFDPEAYKEYVEESLDFEVKDGLTSEKYISDTKVREALKYNYDEYIEKSIKPDILENYIYLDYVTNSSKYKGQFSNQYAVELEVLKIDYDTSKLNGAWNESLIKDVKAVTSGAGNVVFATDYSFVTFNSNNEMILFTSAADKLSYDVYTLTDANVDANVPSYIARNGKNPIRQLDLAKADDVTKVNEIKAASTHVAEKSWVIDATTATADSTFYKHIEELLVARKLWIIDYEVVLAKNYDYKTTYYDGMTETEKTEAQGYASTYSNSNAKPLKEVAKEKKISAQQTKYYSEPEYYTKSTYTNVLPTTISSLRGTSAKDLMANLKTFNTSDKFLLPGKSGLSDPVYLDTSSNTYYICEVYNWYGLYQVKDNNLLDSSLPSKQISNYQIEAYQKGVITPWVLNSEGTRYVEDTKSNMVYSQHPEAFTSVIELVQTSAKNIITDSMRKEAIVELFNKYSLSIHDQDIYDYMKGQYPDYFETEE